MREMDSAKQEFVASSPWFGIPCICILCIASFVGTLGNILVLIVIARKRKKSAEYIFMMNLAFSDLYVTTLADPMSIVAKLEGEQFFETVPGLCQTIASICTISCITSLMTIAVMSINRYIYICKNSVYRSIFTKRNSVLICVSLYGIGTTLVLLNTIGIGDHSFDRKSIECIWDRMATYPYTVTFTVCLVWIPSIITGVCFLKIYLYVRNHRRKIIEQQAVRQTVDRRAFRLAKTLFFIYAVFVTCWAPYALLIAIDHNDEFPHELHVYITMFAHLHPSINWLIYYLTNKNFADAYKQILARCTKCKPFEDFVTASVHVKDDVTELNGDKRTVEVSHETRMTQTQLCDTVSTIDNRLNIQHSALSPVQSESET